MEQPLIGINNVTHSSDRPYSFLIGVPGVGPSANKKPGGFRQAGLKKWGWQNLGTSHYLLVYYYIVYNFGVGHKEQ